MLSYLGSFLRAFVRLVRCRICVKRAGSRQSFLRARNLTRHAYHDVCGGKQNLQYPAKSRCSEVPSLAGFSHHRRQIPNIRMQYYYDLVRDGIFPHCRGIQKGLLQRRLLILPGRANQQSACPAPFVKIFPFPFDPNHFYIARTPAHTEGRFAIVTDVGLGMRWTRVALLTRALTLRTAKSCGPDASMVGVKLRGRKIREATVTRKPDHRGEHEGNR